MRLSTYIAHIIVQLKYLFVSFRYVFSNGTLFFSSVTPTGRSRDPGSYNCIAEVTERAVVHRIATPTVRLSLAGGCNPLCAVYLSAQSCLLLHVVLNLSQWHVLWLFYPTYLFPILTDVCIYRQFEGQRILRSASFEIGRIRRK